MSYRRGAVSATLEYALACLPDTQLSDGSFDVAVVGGGSLVHSQQSEKCNFDEDARLTSNNLSHV